SRRCRVDAGEGGVDARTRLSGGIGELVRNAGGVQSHHHPHPVPPCQHLIHHSERTTGLKVSAAPGCAVFSIERPPTTIASSALSEWGPAPGTAGEPSGMRA